MAIARVVKKELYLVVLKVPMKAVLMAVQMAL